MLSKYDLHVLLMLKFFEAIESLLNQTYTNFEFLIIENCSNDSSVEIIKSYKDGRIRLIIEEDCGQVKAYNRGFKEAKGEYIFIHDQDDLSDPNRFSTQLVWMIINKLDICGSYYFLIGVDKKKMSKIVTPIQHANIMDELLYKNAVIFNSSVCIKKYVFETLQYFYEEYFPSSDYEFYLRGIKIATCGNVPKFLYYWRQHLEQITNSYNKIVILRPLEISLKYKKYFPKLMTNTYTGLVYYYNEKLLLALYFFLTALVKDKISKKLLRYLFLTTFLGIPIKIVRKFKLEDTKIYKCSQNQPPSATKLRKIIEYY